MIWLVRSGERESRVRSPPLNDSENDEHKKEDHLPDDPTMSGALHETESGEGNYFFKSKLLKY